MSAGRALRRRLDRQLRLEGKPRATFRIIMMKDGRLSETVAVDHQDARVMIHSVEQLLTQLKMQVGLHEEVSTASGQGHRQGPVPAAPQAAAARYFGETNE